jgi:hypothetical protein
MMPGEASPALISSLVSTIIIVTKILSYTFTVFPYNAMDTSDYVVCPYAKKRKFLGLGLEDSSITMHENMVPRTYS